jgi:hypothetical protein
VVLAPQAQEQHLGDEDKTMMNYAITARWSRGWVNARAILFSDA